MAWPTPLPKLRKNAIALSMDRQVVLGPEIGRGSAAVVHSGVLESSGMRRRVALKMIGALSSDEDREGVLPCIVQAVQQAALVAHPNVATIYDLAAEGPSPIVISELVHGRSLEAFTGAFARLDRKIPPDLVLFIAAEIADGLAGARDARDLDGALLDLHHGELSAREVLLSFQGEVKITDFGLAQAIRPSSGVRTIRAFARRAATLAPEIARGRRPDARSDVFSLGILVREMLIGPRWPESMDEQEAFSRAREGDLGVNVLEPRLYEPVADILKRALAVDPDHRYPHAGSMAYELRRVCLQLGVGDSRIFLRNAMRELFIQPLEDDIERTAPRDPGWR